MLLVSTLGFVGTIRSGSVSVLKSLEIFKLVHTFLDNLHGKKSKRQFSVILYSQVFAQLRVRRGGREHRRKGGEGSRKWGCKWWRKENVVH